MPDEARLPAHVEHQCARLRDQSEAFGVRAVALDSASNGRLARSLAMAALAFGRAWTSGQAALQDVGTRGITLAVSERMPASIDLAVLDVITFLTIADMVMDDAAILILGSIVAAHGDQEQSHDQASATREPSSRKPRRNRERAPWLQLVDLVDGETTLPGWQPPESLVRLVRELDLGLREARNRLVAHREADHAVGLTWHADGPTLHAFGPDLAASLRMMRGAARQAEETESLGNEISWEAYWRLRDELGRRAGELAPDVRTAVKDAMRVAGFDLPPLLLAALWLRDLADAALALGYPTPSG